MYLIELPDQVQYIIDRLASHGYDAYAVGGAVRDSLLGREVGDYDITTDALPDDIKRVLGDEKIVETGLKHGTLTVVIGHRPYEVTTYRIDGDYKDNRHPDAVIFTDRLAEDLERRDFTVNAMCYNPRVGLVDLYGGREDIERRLIRAVGDPRARFSEDGLRILRGLRFASVLDFEIEDDTAAAIREKKDLLCNISRERIYQELKKLLAGAGMHRILTEYADVISVALGGFTVRDLPAPECFDGADLTVRMCAVFYFNSDDPVVSADRVLTDLRADKLTRTCVCSTLSGYIHASLDSRGSLLRALRDYGEDVVRGMLRLGIMSGRYLESDLFYLDRLLEGGPVFRISGLDIRGGDLLAMGIRGERVGTVLDSLLDAVIDGVCENRRAALAEHAEKYLLTDLERK